MERAYLNIAYDPEAINDPSMYNFDGNYGELKKKKKKKKKKNTMLSKKKKRSDVMDHRDMVVSGADDNLKKKYK